MLSHLSHDILIREVGLRDGLQAEQKFVPTEDKLSIAHALTEAGLREIEATSFVSPRAVPQMRDAAELVDKLGQPEGVTYSALVVNRRGAEDAIKSGVKELQYVVSCSETHSQKNVRMSVEDALGQAAEITGLAKEHGLIIRTALATTFGCPYEGKVSYDRVYELLDTLFSLGVQRVSLADTAGLGNPQQVSELVRGILTRFPADGFSLHFHDTRGLGLACVLAGLWGGIQVIESSIGGLGGCPFIPNATGNIATEDVVYMVESMGVSTGLDRQKLMDAALLTEKVLGRELNSRQLSLARNHQCQTHEW
ncbi:hydroxymethylglutaryl-CoA lyase [Dethiobacter alkaliphilus]|uniref:hydroxymethylglutaryl-CoA lyase n=1 Tax=Dethiobacter alkaliphilus TaxID=427926 RepID=UPI002225E1A6|nr:hydroxymethylglutaryl-CoA lyase [Dethiobacter alkaliphilus]MCW3488777.1 hydroxymethylglutaryl-CoA lyase [Dethiobacter alkaliphilus]